MIAKYLIGLQKDALVNVVLNPTNPDVYYDKNKYLPRFLNSVQYWGHGAPSCTFKKSLYSLLSAEDASWLHQSILRIRNEANAKRLELLNILRQNPHQPIPMLSNILASLIERTTFSEYAQYAIVHFDFFGCYQWLPTPALGFLLYFSLLILYVFPLSVLMLSMFWLDTPHCFFSLHKVSDTEKEWFSSALKDKDHLSCENIDKYILSELEKVAEKLTENNPENPFYACKDQYSWTESNSNDRVYTFTRETFEIRQGNSSVTLDLVTRNIEA